MVKICPSCGTENKETAIICSECMEDISSIAPEKKNKAIIIFQEKEYPFENQCIIGREHFMSDALSEYKTVSRKHVKISHENNSWFVEDLNSTNGTYVNGEKIKNKTQIENNSRIGLGKKVTIIFKL